MRSPFAIHKLSAMGRIGFGVALVLLGLGLQSVPRVILIVWGAVLIEYGATRWIRIRAHERRLLEETRGSTRRFRRASLPRQIYLLLLAVAEADGPIGAEERALVRRFVFERFVEPVTVDDLQAWESQRIPPEQVTGLALELRRLLSPAECETVFYWSCLVAFADRRFRADEHVVLQDVAHGLGLSPVHARVVFHHAKARALGEETRFRSGGRSQHDGGAFGGGAGSGARRRPATPRQRALSVLGLEDGAGRDEIRRRHRELVKRYHPDAHAHLGARAAEEAARRFREIQQAYESLNGG